jgi:hypothetical protein
MKMNVIDTAGLPIAVLAPHAARSLSAYQKDLP